MVVGYQSHLDRNKGDICHHLLQYGIAYLHYIHIKQFTLLVSTIKEQGILLYKSFWFLDIKIVDFLCVKYTLNTCL
jgi:hypothetical protein